VTQTAVYVDKLGGRVAVDSCFLISVHGKDAHTENCRRIVESIDEHALTLVIPLPVLAENLLSRNEDWLSTHRNLEFASFDPAAAKRIAEIGNLARLSKTREDRNRLKYDAMVVATAAAHGADCIVSDDVRLREMANRLNLPAFSSKELVGPALGQQSIRLLDGN
jgi:predicted nucleic acid-binding protein